LHASIFKDKDFKCADDYQKTTLTMIFSVKHDLRRISKTKILSAPTTIRRQH
jgi:hypothetical protein